MLQTTQETDKEFRKPFVYILPERFDVMFRFGRLLDFPLFQRMPFYAVARGRVPGIYKTW